MTGMFPPISEEFERHFGTEKYEHLMEVLRGAINLIYSIPLIKRIRKQWRGC